jgi:ParB family chromosome partitioning protein
MDSAKVISNLKSSTIVEQLPSTESQARPLTKFEPEEQREIWQQVIERAEEKPITAALVSEVVEEIKNNKPHVSNNSGENEWYTPERFIEAARKAMGSIDTDPASSDLANETVKAQTYFTVDDNGLSKQWGGNVWMNPPYAQPLITQFTKLLSNKFDDGEINQACVLVNNATETGWFQRMLESCNCLCLLKSRVKFIDKSGSPSGAPLQGQIVLYFGENTREFVDAFSEYGKVLYG